MADIELTIPNPDAEGRIPYFEPPVNEPNPAKDAQ